MAGENEGDWDNGGGSSDYYGDISCEGACDGCISGGGSGIGVEGCSKGDSGGDCDNGVNSLQRHDRLDWLLTATGTGAKAKGERPLSKQNYYLDLDQHHQFPLRHALIHGLGQTAARMEALTGYDHFRTCDTITSRIRPGSEFRWLLVSGPGSGSGWHVDPWNSSAWNLLLHGFVGAI